MVRVAFLWHMHQPPYRDPLDQSAAIAILTEESGLTLDPTVVAAFTS